MQVAPVQPGDPSDPSEPPLRPALEDGVALYRHMVTLRLVSVRMVDLQRTEKIASHSACLGEEALIAATAAAARPNDWIFPGAVMANTGSDLSDTSSASAWRKKDGMRSAG